MMEWTGIGPALSEPFAVEEQPEFVQADCLVLTDSLVLAQSRLNHYPQAAGAQASAVHNWFVVDYTAADPVVTAPGTT